MISPPSSAPSSSAPGPLPIVVVHKRGAARLAEGHAWVFRSDIQRSPKDLGPGPVHVADTRGKTLGTALWAPGGALALRVWGPATSRASVDEWVTRIHAANQLRERCLPQVHALRVAHAEADGLPGLFVDRYGSAAVVQSTCSGAQAMLPTLVPHLVSALGLDLVVRRDDGSARDMESLPRIREVLHGNGPTAVQHREGSLRMEVDLLTGPKTGAFLDQRENHLLAGRLARASTLDLFSCSGAFGLQAALQQGGNALCVEQDTASATRIAHNAALNNLTDRVEVRTDNAFDVVRQLDDAGKRFDLVVVDPPALAKRQGDLDTALKGYFELNRRALRLTARGGLVMTFSCSGKVSATDLLDVVQRASEHAARPVQVLAPLGAGADHPQLLGLEETGYLKGLLLCVG